MDVTVERLQAARKAMVRIVQERKDGAKYMPVILDLERRIAAKSYLSDDFIRILNEAI